MSDKLGIVSAAVKASAVPDVVEPHEAPATLPWIVTISREAGIDAGGVARQVVELLTARGSTGKPWQAFDRELVDRVAAEHQVDPALVQSVDERDEALFEHMMHGLTSAKSGSGLAVKIAQTVRKLADGGHVVIVGRGGQSILARRDHAVHVRMFADERWRAANVARAESVDEHSALRSVRRIDHERVRFVKHHFNHDPSDRGLYHLILNMGLVEADAAAPSIVALVEEEGGEGGG